MTDPGATPSRPSGARLLAMTLTLPLLGRTVTRSQLIVGGAIVAIVGLLSAGGYMAWRGVPLQMLAGLGYLGIFLIMFVSGASIFLPAPASASVLAAGTVWNPFLVGVAAGLGNATGELINYLVGYGARSFIHARIGGRLATLEGWVRRYGIFAIFAIAVVPNPVFDIVGLVAGSLAFPARQFWLACAVGNCIKYVVLAHLGDAALVWVAGGR